MYRINISFFSNKYESENYYNLQKLDDIYKDDGISFAVLGNIKNSINIFDRDIMQKINNDQELDFVVSTGNGVRSGSEDKYIILEKTLNKINVPTIVGIGDNEVSDDGAMRFYEHYGPLFFSYTIDDAFFLFIDTTGTTSEVLLREWILDELETHNDFTYKFVFMNRPAFIIEDKTLLNSENNHIEDEAYRTFLTNTFSKYNVTAVFSSGSVIHYEKNIAGVDYFNSGGAGGELIVNDENSFYHYMKVTVKDGIVDYSVVKQETLSNNPFYRVMQNIWVYIHALFYTNFINSTLLGCLLILLVILLYYKIFNDIDYYPDFEDSDDDFNQTNKLNVAMFTNNYYPFIGGVPISIKRLAIGLSKLGHQVTIFAPMYPENNEDECNVVRCKLLVYHHSKEFDFAIVNILSKKINQAFLSQNFDIVHLHHPFWMGKKGMMLAKLSLLPIIFTYHTRYEKYSHYLPLFQKTFQNLFSHHMIKKFSQNCDGVIAPTTTAKEYLENIGVSKEKFILPTGINIDLYQNINPDDIKNIKEKYHINDEMLLCSVSRLSKEKNIYFLLDGLKYIHEQSKVKFKCLLIGDGPEKQNINNKIKENHLEEVVYLTGSIPNDEVIKYYTASDIFIFSSVSETQGMVLLEAMAGKCPIVAIRSSGTDDVIINNYNGFKTKKEVTSWAQKVIYLMENEEKLLEMSNNAYEFAQNNSIDAMAKNVQSIYFKKIHQNKVKMHIKKRKDK
jgi:glycosyltransferase involved in cell wall biosynthesis